MKVPILEPLWSFLRSDDIESAVSMLLKPSNEKKVDDSSDWLDQSEFRHAWLAAREIYAAWHEQNSLIWRKVWKDNPAWSAAGLRPLTTAEMKDEEYPEPSMDTVWNDEWFGWAFRTKANETVSLNVYVHRDKVYLNIWYPELSLVPPGWEPDSDEDAEKNSVYEARWGDKSIDVAPLSEAATSMLQALAEK